MSFYVSFCLPIVISEAFLFLIILFHFGSFEYLFKEFRGIIFLFLSLYCFLPFPVLHFLLLNLMVKQHKTEQNKARNSIYNSSFCVLNSSFMLGLITTFFLLRYAAGKKYTACYDVWQNKRRSIVVYPQFTSSRTVYPFIFSYNEIVNFNREGSLS